MLELLNAFGLLGFNQVVGVFYGLVRTKILAFYLGPAGIGIIAQANTLLRSVVQISMVGIGGGYSKIVAEYQGSGDTNMLNRAFLTVIVIFTVIGLTLLGVTFRFSEELAVWAFGDIEFAWIIPIIGLAGILFTQAQVIMQTFRGLLRWREYTFTTITGYAISIFVTTGLIFAFGLRGAVWSFLTAQLINVVLGLLFLWRGLIKEVSLYFWKYLPSKKVFFKLLRFIGPIASVQLFSSVSRIWMRGTIIRDLGADTNGLYQVVWGISVAYMALIRNPVQTYGIPKIATKLQDKSAITQVQNDSLRVSMFMLIPLSLGFLATREIWIPILYSPAFIAGGAFLVWQVAGDILLLFRVNLNISILALERFKYIWVEGLTFFGGWVAIAILFMPQWGILAVVGGYFITNLFILIPSYVYHVRTTNFHLSQANRRSLIIGLPLTIAGLLVGHFVAGLLLRWVLVGFILLAMLIWMPSSTERVKAVDFLWEKIEPVLPERLKRKK